MYENQYFLKVLVILIDFQENLSGSSKQTVVFDESILHSLFLMT